MVALTALSRRQVIAVAAYTAFVGALVAGTVLMALDLEGRSRDVATAQARFDQLSERAVRQRTPDASQTNVSGSPFLDGRTVTIAGAELQQRIERAVAKAGGVLSSSQVELDGPEAAQGFVRLTAAVELDQAAIQALLYDLEAGMPYLFVDSISVLSRLDVGEAEGGKMRMTLGVTGQWRRSD